MIEKITKRAEPQYGHTESYLKVEFDTATGLIISKIHDIHNEDGELKERVYNSLAMNPEEFKNFTMSLASIFSELSLTMGDLFNSDDKPEDNKEEGYEI